jgi:3-hydroxyacyl-CoA dehydrogenase/enoyl-CoA hydratase/3-hydroxybutyryl-CoA epimerase
MSIQESIRIVPKGDIAVVEFDLIGERVNKLSTPVMKRLEDVCDELAKSSYKAVVFVSRKPKIYIAGADIEEIKAIRDQAEALKIVQSGQAIISKIEDLPMPTLAAINGACLGGGCEFVLACDYRLASDDPSTKIGLPETLLGIIPGFGGCIRLPRVIGAAGALDIILAGKNVDGRKAEKLGLVDKCVPAGQLEARAMEFAKELIGKGSKKRRKYYQPKSTIEKFLDSFLGRMVVFKKAREAVLAQSKGHYPAPIKALEVVKKTYGMSNREKALAIEAHAFSEVAVTEISKNLIHIFYMTEAIKKQTGVADPSIKPIPVQRVGVLGAGTMGGGIAQLAADKGMEVRVKDISNDALSKAFQTAYDIWDKSLKRKKITRFELNSKMALISGGTTFDGFGQCDLVVEAIVEDMEIKKKVIGETAGHVAATSIIATNTSSLSVTEMSAGHPHPENFGGMHFFNPVHKMPLVEVIRGTKSSDVTTATIFDVAKRMGKYPVVVKDGPGFLVNRLLLPYLVESVYLLAEGMSVETLDKYFLDFGMPMGPLHLIDEIGIDVAVKVAKIFNKSFGERAKLPEEMLKLSTTGRLGKKNQKGFYLYDSKGKKLEVDRKIYSELGLSSPKDSVSREDCLKRGIYSMINEAALALIEDRIVNTPQEVDLAMIMGTGFPPFRGGLLKYADSIGTAKICDDLEEYAAKVGMRFKPSMPLKNMAKNNRLFYGG